MQGNLLAYLYVLPIFVIVMWYWRRHARLERASLAALKAATEAGRLAYLSGRIPKKLYATASSPEEGVIAAAGK